MILRDSAKKSTNYVRIHNACFDITFVLICYLQFRTKSCSKQLLNSKYLNSTSTYYSVHRHSKAVDQNEIPWYKLNYLQTYTTLPLPTLPHNQVKRSQPRFAFGRRIASISLSSTYGLAACSFSLLWSPLRLLR